ncbi:MAG: hypothetical protein KDK70_41880, partial [Myxococcales bacterium]|nr:hypothetical protein [Myxococcales bacterium]
DVDPDGGSNDGADGGTDGGTDDGTDGGSGDTTGDDAADTSDTSEPPPMANTMCGDFTCQPEEDADSCPFDCVPYTIAETGMGVGKICERSHTGLLPITEIGAGEYLGVAQGGLYPGGSNERPQAHTEAGLAAAASIAPIDGSICLVSIGMSNTYQKWSMFMTQGVASVPDLNPTLRVANGAVGSHPVDTTADPNNEVWGTIDQQIAGSGCSPAQVQVAWVLHAERGPTGSFLEAAEVFHDDLRATVINLADHFPNLRMIYLSSRAYSGYTDRNNNPEPYAHQGAFVVKWLIEEQIEGSDPALSLWAGAPWLSWGPYLWADGLGPDAQAGGAPGRTIPDDALEYECDDYADDGVHPGMGMRQKVTDQLVEFFTSDPTATPWFLQ